jgi:hypothetical protein
MTERLAYLKQYQTDKTVRKTGLNNDILMPEEVLSS